MRRLITRLTFINRRGLMLQKALTFTLDIVELPGVDGPPEDRHDRQHKQGRDWNEQIEDVH